MEICLAKGKCAFQISSVRSSTSFEHNKAEARDELLPVRYAVATYDFFTRGQMLHLKRHADLPPVVIDITKVDALLSHERQTFDGIVLSLSAASADRYCVLNHFLFDRDLALHHVTRLEYGRLEAICSVVFKLDASHADCVAVFEPESDLAELGDLLEVVTLYVCRFRPLKVDLIFANV